MRRSRNEWLVRGVLAAVAAVCGGLAVTQSFAQVVVAANAELAHKLAPYDGMVSSRLASTMTVPRATGADRQRAGALAADALAREPMAVRAYSVLGFNAQLGGNTPEARRYFGHALVLSRRDLLSQLWAIEDAVGRGKVVEALQHYDETLRVNPQMSEMLYPILGSALADSPIRTALSRTLQRRPPWGDSFLIYAGGSSPNPRATAALLVALQRASVSIPPSASAGAVNALLANANPDEAWAFYTTLRPGVDRRASRDPNFGANLPTPSQLDWTPTNDGSVSVTIQRSATGGTFDFVAPPEFRGVLLQQVQLFPPGSYRLSGHSAGIAQRAGDQLYWSLACRRGQELGRVIVADSQRQDGRFAGGFMVPESCPVQTLALFAQSADTVDGLSGQIDLAQLSAVVSR